MTEAISAILLVGVTVLHAWAWASMISGIEHERGNHWFCWHGKIGAII